MLNLLAGIFIAENPCQKSICSVVYWNKYKSSPIFLQTFKRFAWDLFWSIDLSTFAVTALLVNCIIDPGINFPLFLRSLRELVFNNLNTTSPWKNGSRHCRFGANVDLQNVNWLGILVYIRQTTSHIVVNPMWTIVINVSASTFDILHRHAMCIQSFRVFVLHQDLHGTGKVYPRGVSSFLWSVPTWGR